MRKIVIGADFAALIYHLAQKPTASIRVFQLPPNGNLVILSSPGFASAFLKQHLLLPQRVLHKTRYIRRLEMDERVDEEGY